MRKTVRLVIHWLTTCATCLRPGGVRVGTAESWLMTPQVLRQRTSHWLASSSSRRTPDPHGHAPVLLAALVDMKCRTPRFGCPPLAQHLSRAVSIEINNDVVRRMVALYVRPESGQYGPSWVTVLGHIKDRLWRVDRFRVESLRLKRHWVMNVWTRRLIGFRAAAATSDGGSLCRMFTRATAGHAPPTPRPSDHDPLVTVPGGRATRRVLEVGNIQTVPLVPCSPPFVARLIETIRREYRDPVRCWTVDDLTRTPD